MKRVLATEFEKMRRSEILGSDGGDRGKDRLPIYSPLWQADGKRIRRFAPLEFIGRYMKDFFDYGIATRCMNYRTILLRQCARNLARSVDKIAVLTRNPHGRLCDDLFNVPCTGWNPQDGSGRVRMGESGVRSFAEAYGVLERVTIIAPEENACSKAKVTKQVKRKARRIPTAVWEVSDGNWRIRLTGGHLE